MVQLLADRRDIDFVLHEQFELSRLSEHERYADFKKPVIDMIITEVRQLAVKEILPTNKTGDEQGCRFENGSVHMPEGFKEAWTRLAEGEWFAPSQDPAWGGQGIPNTLNVAAQNYLFAANLALMMVAGLNHAAGSIIEKFGTDRQKKLYLKKLYSGEWAGTMLLTEADSGSNLGDLATTAVPNGDGTYSLSGTKIFISGGDQDITDNIVHMVLARIEGGAKGSRGLSLFIVPKILVDEDGNPAGPNDILCTGIEEKMGLHGSPTCTMALGGKGNCTGTLVGKENMGLPIMFLMMNKARLMVGSQGLGCASGAYAYAADYARTRLQGTLPGAPSKSVPIIRHPDVRQMLLQMKTAIEGSRSLLCFIANMEDQKNVAVSDQEKERCQDLIDILIPVAKAYVTDRAVDVCNLAVQIYGGYGYTSEFPVEQLLRDVRITTIYEGTNGIQAMDLLFRKLPAKQHQLFDGLVAEMKKTLAAAAAHEALGSLCSTFESALETYQGTAALFRPERPGGDPLIFLSCAGSFLTVTGDLVFAWMLLWRAVLASDGLQKKPRKKDKAFYQGQLASARFLFSNVLPVTMGKMAAIGNQDGTAVDIPDICFEGR